MLLNWILSKKSQEEYADVYNGVQAAEQASCLLEGVLSAAERSGKNVDHESKDQEHERAIDHQRQRGRVVDNVWGGPHLPGEDAGAD